MDDYYEVLGLRMNASKEEIKDAFRKKAMQFHPDKHSASPKSVRDGATLRFKQASEAYQVLVDDSMRADYNLRFSHHHTSSSSSSAYYGSYSGYTRRRCYYRTRFGNCKHPIRDYVIFHSGCLMSGIVIQAIFEQLRIEDTRKLYEEAMNSVA